MSFTHFDHSVPSCFPLHLLPFSFYYFLPFSPTHVPNFLSISCQLPIPKGHLCLLLLVFSLILRFSGVMDYRWLSFALYLVSTHEEVHTMFKFLSLGYLTQTAFFQIQPFARKFLAFIVFFCPPPLSSTLLCNYTTISLSVL